MNAMKAESTIGGSKLYALFLTLLPPVMMYRFPGLSMGMSTVLTAAMLIYAVKVILTKFSYINFGLVFILSLYLTYAATKSEGANIILPFAILIHVTAISTGDVDAIYHRKIIENISVIAAICVVFQQIVHLLIGVHIPMINSNWVLESIYEDYADAINSAIGVESMYRPCAFFLEPAQFTQFAIYGLGSSLLKDKPSFKKSVVISMGIFATTSGMGFVLAFALWGWWLLFIRKRKANSRFMPKVIGISVVFLIFFLMLMQIPFFAGIVERFTNDGSGDYNAIDGRLFFWASVFGDKSIGDLIYGFGEAELEEGYYYTGFMKILYAYGIIGCVFFYSFWLYLLYKVPATTKAFVIIYIALSFFANQVGFISLIFSIGFILTMAKSYQPQTVVI